MKILGILQPVYLPWLGYFEQIAAADHFILLDDVQYTRRDWRNRNRIKTPNGSTWLTVPVDHHPRSALIHEITISDHGNWPRRHLLTIERNYGRRPHFQPLFDELERVLLDPPEHLVDLDAQLIHLLCRRLEIDTPISLSSEQPRRSDDRQERLLEICRAHGATHFYEGASGKSYIEVEYFRRAGIEVVFQDYRHPIYRQHFSGFLPNQAAIDLIMNTGPEAPTILRSSPLPTPFRDLWPTSGLIHHAGAEQT